MEQKNPDLCRPHPSLRTNPPSVCQALDDEALQKFLDSGSLTLRGHQLTPEDVHVRYSADGPAAAASHYEAHSDNDVRGRTEETGKGSWK